MQAVENGADAAKTLQELVTILMRLIELKSPKLYLHSQQVANYAVSIAAKMRLPRDEIERIRIAAILHDVGQLTVLMRFWPSCPSVDQGAERLQEPLQCRQRDA
jgi:HD-GYP domain-containing protein (c-di-GMP phosphodiesterase class II)